jgi:hypothetical protein
MEFLRFGHFVSNGLHGQMKHDFVAATVRFFRDIDGMRVMGQYGDGQRIGQSEDRIGGGAIVAEIVEDDCETRTAVLFALLSGSRQSGACCDRSNDMHGSRDHAPAAVIQAQKRSGAGLRISREVMRSGDAVQGLNETRDRRSPGLFGAAGRQRDKEAVCSIRMRAVKLEVRDDVSRLFAETR